MEAQLVFEAVAKFEAMAAELYNAMGECYLADAEASAMFFRLALDERGHESLATYQHALAARDPAEFSDVTVDIDDLLKAIELMQDARAALPRLALSAALGAAVDIEASAAERHYRLAMRQSNPAVAALLESLGKADSSHRAQLEEFVARRGVRSPHSDAPRPVPV